MTAEVVWRVQGIGDYCAGCGDALEPGELVLWGRDGGMHESCAEDGPMTATKRTTFTLRCNYGTACDQQIEVEASSAAEARQLAAMQGWFFRYLKDYCPDHAAKARPA